MKARDHEEHVWANDEKQRVRESPHTGAPHVFEHHREMLGIVRQSLHDSVNFMPKSATQSRRFAFIPILRAKQLRSCGLTE